MLVLCAKSLQSCPTRCDPMDCNPSGSSVRGTLQARILEGAAISFSRGSFWPRDRICVSCLLNWQAGCLPLVPCGKSWNKWLVESESSLKDLGLLSACLVELLAHFLPPFGRGERQYQLHLGALPEVYSSWWNFESLHVYGIFQYTGWCQVALQGGCLRSNPATVW